VFALSFSGLIKNIIKTNNRAVLGLDPALANVPVFLLKKAILEHGETLKAGAQAAFEFNKGLIDALCDIVPAVKPQSAFYELYGAQGAVALEETVKYAKNKGMFVIADGKRNDIGTTMEAYAAAFLGKLKIGGTELEPLGADALTVNGYLGTDGIEPLLEICKTKNKGIFVLAKTSNQSSGELQDKRLENGQSVYEFMASMCEKWGENSIDTYGYGAVGAVVGATYPEQLTELRKKCPHTFFLVPGYGAQGGAAADIAGAFDTNGLGAIINSSRGIMCAYKKEGTPEEDYQAAARREAIRMRDEINAFID
jgi:orotidine-5'-phosphate decarboxylase